MTNQQDQVRECAVCGAAPRLILPGFVECSKDGIHNQVRAPGYVDAFLKWNIKQKRTKAK